MRVSLITLGDPGKQTGGYLYHRRLADAAADHDAEMSIVSFPDWAFPLPVLAGHQAIARSADADVVVVDSIALAFTVPWLGSVTGPIFGSLHQGPGGIDHGRLRTRVQGWLDRRGYERLRTLLVASASLAEDLTGLHHDIRVVPPGRDVAPRADDEIHDLRRGRRCALLCVGNWVPRKGIVELLDAFAAIPTEAATLHLVGDDAADPRYSAQVRMRLGRLDDRVVVHSVLSTTRVAALYRDADAFALASYREPYGTVYGEAMAAGLPVVGWRAGNLPHLADHEREGLVVEPGDVDALARALQRIAEDADLRVALSEGARRRALAFPTWAETAAQFFGSLRSSLD